MSDRNLLGIGMTSRRTRERLAGRLEERGIRDQRVLDLVRHMPRHLFVDEALASRAYEDTALPIGFGQTISQPFVVARMTEALLAGGSLRRVLEVGTGSGYQTAILAQLADSVFTVERISALLQRARQRLRRYGIRNVRFGHSDGTWGWPAEGPFDGILVTAAPRYVPEALVEQLSPEGRLVLPLGPPGEQKLVLVHRRDGELEQQVLDTVSFVPLRAGEE